MWKIQFFTKVQRQFSGEKTFCSANGAGTTGSLYANKTNNNKTNFKPYLAWWTEINTKLIPNLNVRTKTIILLEKNVGSNLCDLGFDKIFLNKTLKA